MTLKFQLASGSKLEVDLAPIEPALNLFHIILNECKNANLDLTIADDTTIMKMIMQNKDALLNIFSSDEVQNAVLECSKKVIYNSQHFELAIFEDVKNRRDFFGSLIIIALENLRPFFPEVLIYFQPIANLFLK